MKKTVLLVLFFAVSMSVLAQTKSVKKYYYWINQAELAICDSNYQKASDYYHQAFSIKRANIRDAYFAFQLNQLYSNNLERTCEAFHFLVQAGNKAHDEYGPYLDDTTAYPELWKCMKTISDTTKSLVDVNLYNALNEIRKDDQRVRTAYYENDDLRGSTIDQTDSLNFQKIQQIFKQFKNIDEYNSGMTIFQSTVFIHFARLQLTTPDIYYEKMVKDGNLSASNYMQNYDYCYHTIYKDDDKTTYGTNPSYTYVINNTFFVRHPDNIQKINKNRKKLNIAETWEDYVKKVMYVYYNHTPFRFYPRQTMIYGEQDVQEQREKEERARFDNGEIKGIYYEFNLEK